jgi:hypothetical protein
VANGGGRSSLHDFLGFGIVKYGTLFFPKWVRMVEKSLSEKFLSWQFWSRFCSYGTRSFVSVRPSAAFAIVSGWPSVFLAIYPGLGPLPRIPPVDRRVK